MAVADRIYEQLVNEEDARVCTGISDDACTDVPSNFVRILLAQFLTKLGDAVASPKIVLAWVMATISAPAALTGFLVPVRESGSLIPQLVIAAYVRRRPVRKYVWVFGSVLQAIAIALIGVVAMTLTGAVAGWAILGLLACFSLSRGLCSVASKDVVGKTIPKRRRGRLTGWSASGAGLVVVALGGLFILSDGRWESAAVYGGLILGAGGLWIAAALVYSRVRELPGETAGGGNALATAVRRLALLRDDRPFRRFVIARSLLLCSALTAPFYVLLAHEHLGEQSYLLGLFLASSGLASLVSAPVWGRFADTSARRTMIAGALLTAAVGAAVWGADRGGWLADRGWLVPAAYFVLSIAHSGVRVGRKTYVVDLASGNKRTDYVAVSNSVIGVALLLSGSVGALTQIVSTATVVLILSAFGVLGALLARALPETQTS